MAKKSAAVAAKPTAKKAKEKVTITTPIGRLSFPYLAEPDSGRQYSDDKYKTDILIPKPVWVEQAKGVIEAVLKVGREYFGNPKLQLKDFKNPFFDMDNDSDCPDFAKGHVRLRAKSQFAPVVIGPKKGTDGRFPVWDKEQIAKIKGGDHARIVCAVYGYPQQGGGVTLGLNVVQFAYEGGAIGQGVTELINSIDEIEVEIDDPAEMTDTEDSQESEDSALNFG